MRHLTALAIAFGCAACGPPPSVAPGYRKQLVYGGVRPTKVFVVPWDSFAGGGGPVTLYNDVLLARHDQIGTPPMFSLTYVHFAVVWICPDGSRQSVEARRSPEPITLHCQ